MPHTKTLDAIINRAIPFDPKCAMQEGYNKARREWLKKEFEAYLREELSDQFNARAIDNQGITGIPTSSN